jgi:hypothetical protein
LVRTTCDGSRTKLALPSRKALDNFGVTSNYQGINRFYRETRRAWHKWLCRRSNAGHVTWERMLALLERFPLPRPRIVRSYAT